MNIGLMLRSCLIFVLVLCSIGLVSGALADGTQAYWTLDNVLTDATGNGNTLTNNGATYTADGKINGAYEFDGTNDYMDTSLTNADIQGSFSVSAWVNPDTITGQQMIFNSQLQGFSLEKQSAGFDVSNTYLFLTSNAGGSYTIQTAQNTVNTGVWTHIVGTWDGSIARIYINGVESTAFTRASTMSGNVGNTANPILIGKYQAENNRYFDGKIDEPAIWNRALSEAEINELHNIQKDGLESGQFPFITEEPLTNRQINRGRLFVYDTKANSNRETINTLITDYGYFAVETLIDYNTLNTNINDWLQVINDTQTVNQNLILTLDIDLDTDNMTNWQTLIETEFSQLITGDYLQAILMIKLDVNSATPSTINSEKINDIAQAIATATDNFFPIYVKEYSHIDLNTNFVNEDEYTYITSNDLSDYLTQEITALKTDTNLSRFYYVLTDTFKQHSSDYNKNIISRLTSTVKQNSTIINDNVIELNNNDLVIINNDTIEDTYNININTTVNTKSAYLLLSKSILDYDVFDDIIITLQSNSYEIVSFRDLLYLKYEDENTINLFSSLISNYPVSLSLDNSTDAVLFHSSNSNAEDGRILLTDPSYIDMGFYTWYGTYGFEAINDFSRYPITIIGDKNQTFINDIVNITETYGYTAVNTYGNNNAPDGCTPSVDCSEWNRTIWYNSMITDIDEWADTSVNMNIFIDGLDIGDVNDVDGLFSSALVSLSDYVRYTINRKIVLNTYTAYQDYALLGDYTMRESACARWDGSPSEPVYSYEDMSLEFARANFHRVHNVPVLAQAFGEITDYKKAEYCYYQTKVLYGDLAHYSYNQPLFDYTGAKDKYSWNFYKFYDLGTPLENDYRVEGNEIIREFERGIVRVNTVTREAYVDNQIEVTDLEFCAWFYDNDDTKDGRMHFVINRNLTRSFDVYDSELTAFTKTQVCTQVNPDYYERSGFYEIEFYYIPDEINNGNTGMYMYRGTTDSDQLSAWENILNDHPSNNKDDYFLFTLGNNWAVDFNIDVNMIGVLDNVRDTFNKTITNTQTDITAMVGIDTYINRTKEINVSYSSTENWQGIPFYDRAYTIDGDSLLGVTYNNDLWDLGNASMSCASVNDFESIFASDLSKCYTQSGNNYNIALSYPMLSSIDYSYSTFTELFIEGVPIPPQQEQGTLSSVGLGGFISNILTGMGNGLLAIVPAIVMLGMLSSIVFAITLLLKRGLKF